MRLLRPFVSFAFVVALAASARAQAGCTVSGITTSDFGSSCAQLSVTFSASSCTLDVSISPSSATSQGFLLIGNALDAPMELPSPPFGDGCSLLVAPAAAFPLFLGGITVPPIPQLAGQSIDLQGLSLSFSIPPTAPVILTTQGVHLTFN